MFLVRKERGNTYPLGVSPYRDGINIALEIPEGKECGVRLWKSGEAEPVEIPFEEDCSVGGVSCMYLPETDSRTCSYQVYADGEIVKDRFAKGIAGKMPFGRARKQKEIRYTVAQGEYDWEGDRQPCTAYENSFFYCMHIRGFTKHASSKTAHRGTFSAAAEKLDYLKELGITAVELMPVYDFSEVLIQDENRGKGAAQDAANPETKLNYWGYTADSHYFLPKAAYAASGDASAELKDMIKAFHKRGIEVILQFYFEKEPLGFIFEVLKYWLLEYHIDGFHLKGDHIPLELIAGDPLFKRTKLLYYHFPYEELYPENHKAACRSLASYRDDFMYDMRRFLKGDENMVLTALGHIRHNGDNHGVVQYLTNYYGFTLADLVAYETKHNEENGENNRDGADLNCSWNCGAEGASRKKAVLRLRGRQMRNAMDLLFLSQGTPLIFAGDEFGNSQKGNNNPYCQDNDISWLNWNLLERNRGWFEYVKSLAAFRKSHPVLHGPGCAHLMDTLSCGYPDVSYHGEEAWRPGLEPGSRHVGILYYGKYAEKEKGIEDDTIFVAYNMHWQEQKIALPHLPRNQSWYFAAGTQEETPVSDSPADLRLETRQKIVLPPRTVSIYVAKSKPPSGKVSEAAEKVNNKGME